VIADKDAGADCTPAEQPIAKRLPEDLEHSVSCSGLSQLQRKKKQVQFRSSADITVLARDSLSDEFSEELESELESIFKRMRLQSKWALPEGDKSKEVEVGVKHDSESVAPAQPPEAHDSSDEGTTYFSTVVVKTSTEEPRKFSHASLIS
jgi:hypothetical protein